MQKNVASINLVIKHVESKIRFRLRLKVNLSLENPNFVWCFQAHSQSPHLISVKRISEVRALPSTGITRHHRYYCPFRLPPEPIGCLLVTGRDPAFGTGLPRYPGYLSDMLPPLPRWIETSGSVTSPLRLGLPRILGGSASTTFLSRPAQGSLGLRPARLLQPHRLTSVPRASAGRSPYPTVWVATGMNRQFPGRNFHPLVSYALVAHQYIGVGLFV